MNLTPLLEAPLAVKLHVATVLPAFVLGAYLILASKKGAPLHRALGYLYLSLMGATSLAAMFVHGIAPDWPLGLSPIHLFVPLTLYYAIAGWRAARAHNVRAHKNAMLGLYTGALLIAGAFTFLPGRIMFRIFFGP